MPAVRYTANLTAALSIARSDLAGFRREFDALIAQMRTDAPALPFSTADVDFLSAQAVLADANPGKALAALAGALAKEPEFFAAAALAVSNGACRPAGARQVSYWRTVFPLMANWLPLDEAREPRSQFAAELARLEAA